AHDPAGRDALDPRRRALVVPSADFDTPWKAVLERFFEAFLEFALPPAHAAVDWSRPAVFHELELRQLAPEAAHGTQVVDLLAQDWLPPGEDAWVLIHVEVPAQPEAPFAERLFRYHARLLDKFGKPVVGLAVLADDRPAWRPSDYATE